MQHLVEVDGVGVFKTSKTSKYTALDFAEWEVEQQSSQAPQCADVVVYLRERMGLAEGEAPRRLDLRHSVVPYAQNPHPPPLAAQAGSSSNVPAQPPVLRVRACPGPDTAHIPTQKSARTGGREYYLFTAARDGCLACVQMLVEEELVDVFATSKTQKYTALDFAEWEVSQETSRAPGCAHVVAYLRDRMGASRGPPPPPPPPRYVDV